MITFEHPLHAVLHYHVLAHLDLGRDAASLHDPSLPAQPWGPPLGVAYAAAAGRLTVHFLPLWVADLAGLRAALGPALPAALRDTAGHELAARLLAGLAAEEADVRARFGADAAAASARRAAAEAELAPPLASLREALYAEAGEAPPPLRVLDCPPLRLRGRGARIASGRVVAVSLAAPLEHALCQVFHEETHVISDPRVHRALPAGERTTRVGAPGHAIHMALERAAVALGRAVVRAHAPGLADAYERWCRPFGL